jgi:hypothetical protein
MAEAKSKEPKKEGLSAEEQDIRAQIRRRAEQLIDGGMSNTQAAKQAFSELYPTYQQSLVKEPTQFEQATQEAAAESPAAVQKLQNTRASFVDQKAGELELAGYQPEQSRARAEKEFEDTFIKPVKTPYGELSERVSRGVFGLIEPAKPTSISPKVSGAEASLEEALRPQTFLPESAVDKEERRMARPAQVGIIGQGPDFEVLQKELQKDLGAKDADIQIRALRKAYERNLIGATKPPAEVWQDTIAEVQNIPKLIADENNYVKNSVQTGGPADPLFLAFSRQVKEGKGVPKLSEAQGLFLSSVAQDTRADKEAELRKEYADKPLVKSETEAVEGLRSARPRTVTRELAGADKDAEIARMAAEQVEVPWWSDPKEVEKRLANPEKYTEPGVFQSETPFGTQVESDVGYITRAAMAPLNLVAGAVFPVLFTGFLEEVDEDNPAGVEEARRRLRPEAYKDSPVLLNIAQGRGFVGEAAELAQLTGLNEDKIIGPISVGTLYTAGAFAADLLDPSLDLLAGAAKGGRIAFPAVNLFGTEIGGSTVKAAKRLGIKSPQKFAAAEGIKEAARTVLTETPIVTSLNSAAAKLVGVPKLAPGDIRLSMSDAVARQASDDLLDAQGARKVIAPDAPKPVKYINSRLDELDQLVVPDITKRGKVLSPKEFTDALIEAMVRNPEVATTIRNAERAAAPTDFILSKVKARINAVSQDPQAYRAVQDALIRQSARNIVFKETGNSILKNGIVAVTKNTFATQDQATKILKEYASTPFMKEVIPQIVKTPTAGPASRTFINRSSKVVDGYKMERVQAQKLSNELVSLVNDGLISRSYANLMTQGLYKKFISSADLRFIMDAGIDRVAKKYRIATSKDILEVSPIVAKQISEPLKVRDFSNPLLRKWISGATGKVPTEILSPAQKAIYEPVAAGLGKLDAKLRNEMQKMINSKEFRASYGIPADAKLSRQELLGYLIVGPIPARKSWFSEAPRIQNILKNVIDNSVYAKNTQIDIFDMFSGISTRNVTDVWSIAGRQKIDDLVKGASEIVVQNPAKYAEEMVKLREEAVKLASDPANIKIDPSEVIVGKSLLGQSIKAQTAARLEGVDIGSFINERLVASYYFSESSRLINDALQDVMNVSGMTFRSALNDMSTNLKRAIGTTENLGIYVRRYISAVVSDPTTTRQSLQDIARYISADNPAIMNNAAEFVGEVSSLSNNIMRNNRIFAPEDLSEDLAKIVESASKPGSTVAQNLDVFLGTNVAGQVRKAIEEGGGKQIQKALADAIVTSNDPIAVKFYNAVTNTANTAWYTLTLTGAPRFHGANIIGAPEIIYSTTGKLILPIGPETISAAKVMFNANTEKGGLTAVIDPSGRRYTNNEIYQAVMESGGMSLNKAELSSINARRALIQLDEGLKGKTRRALDLLIESPSTEDAIYRAAVLIDALKEGQPMEQALILSRKSLYDKGDISKYEDVLRRNIMFYSFTRNNFVNLLKNMTDPRGWKRMANYAKTKRGIETIFLGGMTEEEKRFLPDTAATRIVLGKGDSYGDKGAIIVGPTSTQYSALELLTKALALDTEVFIKMTTPRGIGALEDNEIKNIPPEHVFYIKNISEAVGADETEVMSWLVGDQVIPLRSDKPGNVDGYIYPLNSQASRDWYKTRLFALKFIGVSRLISDYAASVRAPGSKTAQNLGPIQTGLYAVGAITPIRTLSAEQQRLRALIAQTKEGKALLKDVEDALQNDALLKEGPPSEETKGIVEKVEAGKQKKREALENLDDIIKEKKRLDAEIKALKREIAPPFGDPTKINVNRAEISKKAARIKELSEYEQQSKEQ